MSNNVSIPNELTTLSQHVASLPKNTPFSVPKDYFDSFPTRLMETILNEASEQDMIELAPLLKSLKHENPYTTPDGYFNNVKFVSPEPETPVVTRLFNMRQFVKYAAAACITGILATILFMPKQKDDTPITKTNDNIEFPSSKLSPAAISFYLEEMDNFSIAESTENEQVAGESNLLVDINSTTIKEILQEIPDKEISTYISQNGFEDIQSLN